jgi:nucleoside-diphosphate-sugar epimerase
MARIVITGGAGFVGSHLAEAAIEAGHDVHLIIRQSSSDHRLRKLEGRFSRHTLDLRSERELHDCLGQLAPEYIYHLAACPRRLQSATFADVRDGISDHLIGLTSLLAVAAHLPRPPRKLIRTGSLAEYGEAPAPYRETEREAPVNAYGAELTAATHMVRALQRRLPFPVVTARLALIYGDQQSTDYLVPRLITRCLSGETTAVTHPQDKRDLLHVDDVVEPLMRLMTAPTPGGTLVNLATGYAPTMQSVAEMIVRLTGCDPDLVTYGGADQSSGIPDFRADTRMARELLSWSARTPLEEGMKRTIASYRKRLVLPERVPVHDLPMMGRAS